MRDAFSHVLPDPFNRVEVGRVRRREPQFRFGMRRQERLRPSGVVKPDVVGVNDDPLLVLVAPEHLTQMSLERFGVAASGEVHGELAGQRVHAAKPRDPLLGSLLALEDGPLPLFRPRGRKCRRVAQG